MEILFVYERILGMKMAFLKIIIPRIYALELRKSINIGDKLGHHNLSESFRRFSRGGAELSQFGDFAMLLQQVCRAPTADRWAWTRNSSGEFTVASKVRQLINRWWDIPDSEFDSYTSRKEWVKNLRLPGKIKLMFEGVYNVMWWLLWWYQHQTIFEAKAPNKAVFFDDVITKSFYWCRYRSKASFSWNDWRKNPNLIIL
nr:RNA-directed DNA polymerase, eukaryota [Tanacetum cinerariifolium]